MVDHTIHLSLAAAALASHPASLAARSEFSALEPRAVGTLSVACYVSTNAGDCDCPRDNNNHAGVLINVFPVCTLAPPSHS
jgi:uncharacterized membrane protein